MKLKLDENIGTRGADILRAAGHEVATVRQQDLCGSSDSTLADVCRRELRTIVTLDIGFGNPLVSNPLEYSGIAVLRLPPKPGFEHLIQAIETLASLLSTETIQGKLWIVQPGRVRVYQNPEEDPLGAE